MPELLQVMLMTVAEILSMLTILVAFMLIFFSLPTALFVKSVLV